MTDMIFSKVILGVLLLNMFKPDNGEIIKLIIPRAYYVSTAGDDKNTGTKKKPFRSIQRLNEVVLKPGDSILFEGGRHFYGSLDVVQLSDGDSLHSSFIGSYGSGSASIHSGNDRAIYIRQVQWLKIKNLHLIGSGRKSGNTNSGLAILSSRFITADSIDVSGFQKSGVWIDSSENISVGNIFAHDNGHAGISVGGTSVTKTINRNIYIGYARTENNPGDPSNLKNHSGNGIVMSGCTNVLIEYCTATNNGWDMPRKGNGPVGIWAFEADSVIIQHCLSYRNKTSPGGEDGGGFDLDGGVTHSIIQYCLSYDNQGAGYCLFQYKNASVWHDNVYRFNISVNDGLVSAAHAGVYVWNSSYDSLQFYNAFFYNNTIYNNKVSALSYSVSGDRSRFNFYNNFFIGKNQLIRGEKRNDLFLGNVWRLSDKENELEITFPKRNIQVPTKASRLLTYRRFQLAANSPFRNSGVNLKAKAGIVGKLKDFNGGASPVKGVGASF